MKGIGIWLSIASLCYACQKQNPYSATPQHKRLLGFKAEFLAEEMDEKYRKLRLAERLESGQIDVVPVRDILYAALPCAVNACGEYKGNISISHDTLYLHYNLISDEVCTSGRVDQLTYIIDNPQKRRYKVIFKPL